MKLHPLLRPPPPPPAPPIQSPDIEASATTRRKFIAQRMAMTEQTWKHQKKHGRPPSSFFPHPFPPCLLYSLFAPLSSLHDGTHEFFSLCNVRSLGATSLQTVCFVCICKRKGGTVLALRPPLHPPTLLPTDIFWGQGWEYG